MTDWPTTLASAATAGGTLILAAATFSSIRSAQRSARATEAALLAGTRPLLVHSQLEDAPQKIGFQDDHWLHLPGGRAILEATDEVIYMLVSLRNVGSGLALLDRWRLRPGRQEDEPSARDIEGFRRLTRDIYVAPGGLGFWQGALRDRTEPLFQAVALAITERERLTLDLLYGDHEGGQRTISRFSIAPTGEGTWVSAVGRHWNIDRPRPR
jgi:hypothetical protein